MFKVNHEIHEIHEKFLRKRLQLCQSPQRIGDEALEPVDERRRNGCYRREIPLLRLDPVAHRAVNELSLEEGARPDWVKRRLLVVDFRKRRKVELARTPSQFIDEAEPVPPRTVLHPVERDVRKLAFAVWIPASDVHVNPGEPSLHDAGPWLVLHHAEELAPLIRSHRVEDMGDVGRLLSVVVAAVDVVRRRDRIPKAEHLDWRRRNDAVLRQSRDLGRVLLRVGRGERHTRGELAGNADFVQQPAQGMREISAAAEAEEVKRNVLALRRVQYLLREPPVGEAKRTVEVRGEHAAQEFVAGDRADSLDVRRLGVAGAVEVLLELPDVGVRRGLVPRAVNADDELHSPSSSHTVNSSGLAIPSEPHVAMTSHHSCEITMRWTALSSTVPSERWSVSSRRFCADFPQSQPYALTTSQKFVLEFSSQSAALDMSR